MVVTTDKAVRVPGICQILVVRIIWIGGVTVGFGNLVDENGCLTDCVDQLLDAFIGATKFFAERGARCDVTNFGERQFTAIE
jgi:hypothetical protein